MEQYISLLVGKENGHLNYPSDIREKNIFVANAAMHSQTP